MNTKTVSGKILADRLRAELAEEVRAMARKPGLGVVLVGDDPASHLYVGLKERACKAAGIRFEKRLLPADASQRELMDAIAGFNDREDVDAILVQLPLPPGFDVGAALGAVRPDKDADGFHERTEAEPVLVEAVRTLIDASGALPPGKAVVVANSDVFADPVVLLLRAHGWNAQSVIDLAVADRLTQNADLIVIAIGRPGWLTKDKVKPGATVIDIGTTRVGDKVKGDADFEGLLGHVAAITPVPGGVGPLTVAFLLKNAVELAKRHRSS